MKIENAEVYGFRAAFRGLRNPYNSWDKSDSKFGPFHHHWGHCPEEGYPYRPWDENQIQIPEDPYIGPNDLALAKNLIKGGSEHRKFLRQIEVWFDITAPIYIWSELDTYCIGKTRNSCSTMHKLGSRDLTQEDFQLPIPEGWLALLNSQGEQMRQAGIIKDSKRQNEIRREYKNLLPGGYLQKATYSTNYEALLSMYFQRKNHRLPEWNEDNPESICSFIKSLPYMKEFIGK